MRLWMLTLCVLLSACYVTQQLKCNHCIDIREMPDCSQPEEIECSPPHSYCLNMTMYPPAYGIVRRCATSRDCTYIKSRPVHLMDANCCKTDLCN
nr:CD59 glycoprotein-like [Paramormyrops kingsleyae]